MGKTPFTLQRFTDCNNSFLEGTLFRSPRFLCFWTCAFLALFVRLGTVAPTGAEEQTVSAVKTMLESGDWLHTVISGKTFLNVTFLHCWSVAILSVLSGEGVTVFIARLPSVIAGIVMILSVISITKRLFYGDAAFITSWLLLTSVPFVQLARTAGPGMMGTAFIFAAVAWYLKKRDGAGFLSYAFFFLLCACGALTNGFVTAVIPCLMVFIDVCIKRSWKRHAGFSSFCGALIGIGVCFLPFILEMMSANGFKTDGAGSACRRFFLCAFPNQAPGSIGEMHIFHPSGLLMPWTLVFIHALIHWISKTASRIKGEKTAMRNDEIFFILTVFTGIVTAGAASLFSSTYTIILLPLCAIMTGAFLSSVKEGKLCSFTNAVFNVMTTLAFIAGLVFIFSPFAAAAAYGRLRPDLLPFTRAEANVIMLILPFIGIGITAFILTGIRKMKKGNYVFPSMKHFPFCGIAVISVFVLMLCAEQVLSFLRIFS